tara:strand:+ start:22248 stop:22547 length:300 start_codon:yes stop_codon:yes gene_type:complete
MNEISIEEFLKINRNNLQIIDIREPYEYKDGHIESLNIPMSQILNSIKLINKEKKVIIYCQSGRRGESVVYMLKRKFQLNNIYNLKGGYKAYLEKTIIH